MSLKGNLESFFLASILQLLSEEKKTGVLRVENNKARFEIIFQDGAIIYALGSQMESRLGNLLLGKGIISVDQLQECLALCKEKKLVLGKILVEKEYISVERLKELLRQQIEEILFKMFLWNTGDFEYEDANLNLDRIVIIHLDIMSLILEATRRVDELSILKKQIPSTNLIFKISSKVQDKQEIKLVSNEWRILTMINGKRSVRQLVNESGDDEFSVLKVLYSLLSSGLIERCDETQSQDAVYSPIISGYNDILRVIFKNLESELGKQTLEVFAKCKPEIKSVDNDIFKNFDLKNPAATNIHLILEEMKGFKDIEKGSIFIINSFNDYILNLFNYASVLLSKFSVLSIIKDIKDTLPFVIKYQVDTAEKSHIVNMINNIKGILKNVEEKIKEDTAEMKKSESALFTSSKNK